MYVKVSIREMCQKRGLFCRCNIISKYLPIFDYVVFPKSIGHTLTYALSVKSKKPIYLNEINENLAHFIYTIESKFIDETFFYCIYQMSSAYVSLILFIKKFCRLQYQVYTHRAESSAN